ERKRCLSWMHAACGAETWSGANSPSLGSSGRGRGVVRDSLDLAHEVRDHAAVGAGVHCRFGDDERCLRLDPEQLFGLAERPLAVRPALGAEEPDPLQPTFVLLDITR